MIADFEFYTNVYHGDILTEETFPRFATRADAWLNSLTFGRYALPDLPEATLRAVRLAECAIAEECARLNAANEAHDPAIQQETVGSHSVKYASELETALQATARIKSLAEHYLLTTGLLNRSIPYGCIH